MVRLAGFDRDALAAAGLEVVREQGWAALTLASVADALDVTPMALYRVVTDAHELRQVVADGAGQPLLPCPVGPLVEELRAWAVRVHGQLRGLRGLAAYVIGEWTELPAWLDIVETFLAHAASEGIVGSDAVHTVNAVFAYTLARCQLRDGISERRRLAPIGARTYPHISANLARYRSAQTETAFQFGLDALITGLGIIARTHTQSPSP